MDARFAVMDDLAQLKDLSESALVKQLSTRFSNNSIYVRSLTHTCRSQVEQRRAGCTSPQR